jgi:hypothetical protein
LAASQAQAAVVVDGEQGTLTIGGDVEFNVNYLDSEANSTINDKSWNQDGRLLLSFKGERQQGHYTIRALAQPTYSTNGDVGTDDVWFEVEKQQSWTLRLGRYEAYDMNPLGQDVFVNHSGDTADGTYNDGAVYIYRMLEGRGRSGSAGQAKYNQQFGDLYLEVSTQFGDTSGFFADDTYHGATLIKNNKNAFVVRPVIAYQMGSFNLALGLETNLISNSTIDQDGNDVSDRTGYGFKANYTENNWSVNLNLARMDALNETDTSLGLNALWNKFGLGYIYGESDISGARLVANSKNKVSTVYSSYQFDHVIVPDLSVYLGAYLSKLSEQQADNDNNLGARVRVKYLF